MQCLDGKLSETSVNNASESSSEFLARVGGHLLWSRRVMAVKLAGLMSGALAAAIKQLVLAGLPTTHVLMFLLACLFMALPTAEKMAPLSWRAVRARNWRIQGCDLNQMQSAVRCAKSAPVNPRTRALKS